MNDTRIRGIRSCRLVLLATTSLVLAAAIGTASSAAADVTGSASTLRKCQNPSGLKLRVENISCAKAWNKVVQQSDSREWKPTGCNAFTLETCRSRISGFKCEHAKKQGRRAMIINSTCKKKRTGKPRQLVRWRVVATG